jgi:ATP-binding cassette subfamily B (MDR/TAP) protein 1
MTMVGAVASIKFQKKLSEGSDDIVKEANVLAGDAILNYRTVASFGNAEQIIKEFDRLMEGPVQLYMRKAHFIGLSFGFSNLSNFVTWAILYYTAARLISDRVIPLDEVSNTLLSIIVILFGAQSSAAAQSHAPDLGKAKVAADKIYGIIDAKGEIETRGDEMAKESAIREGFHGEIEFQDVWFRYPTRKTEWVLRGHNLTLHPNESVALVGESGCGKSTMVALILRFYDVDMGRILLDGKDIRSYPVPLLRSLIGLVQ